jgi:general L-amino acid transport system permease protein
VFVLVAGILAARMIGRWATARQEATGIRPSGTLWMQLGTIFLPFIVVMVTLGATLDIPELRGFNFSGGIHMRNSLIALWFALALYTGAFIAEIVRAGILAISKGQTEAAYALGLRPSRTMNLVILPQAMRVIIPPLISQYLNLTKNSSLAIAVGYMDVRSTLGGITINQTGRELEGMLLLGLFYLVTSLVISGVMNIYNKSVKLKER